MMRLVPFAAVAAFCAASLYQIAHPPTPRLLYNQSASAHAGWYALDPGGPVVRDAKVAAFAPADARKLADNRGYLPEHVPLIKSVWAIGGERICAENGVIRAPNRPDIHAAAQDDLGRWMPVLQGCFTLNADEVFLISTDVQTSWDSRYFGPVSVSDVLGTVRFLGDHPRDLAEIGGGARALGVEGKIKGGSAPKGAFPCLHIICGGAPAEIGSAPCLAKRAMALGVSGSAPASITNVCAARP